MIADPVPAYSSPEASTPTPGTLVAAPPSWPWRRAALLLAVAPAPLAAAAAFTSAPVNLLAAVAGVAVLIAGLVSQVTHIGFSSPRRWWC